MKLDVTCMRYLTKDDFRVLVAIEMGMRNHEMVPIPLITSIAQLRHGGSFKILSTLLRYKLVAHTNNEYNGYRLSYLGYDILALKSLLSKGVIVSVGQQIGIGKESDIFEAEDEHGNEVVIKIHRLGRTSFRSVRKNRDYMAGRSKASWLFMSRLAAVKEFAFMKALYAHGFPTPIPIEQNRHIVAMSKVSGCPLAQVRAGGLADAERIFNTCLAILRRLAEHGLIHCDFNEFNLMADGAGNVTLIDFPQMVSTSHYNGPELLARDIKGLIKFFAMKMHYIPPEESLFTLSDVTAAGVAIDREVKAGGYNENDELERYVWSSTTAEEEEEGSEEEGSDDEDEQEGVSEEQPEGHTEALDEEQADGVSVGSNEVNVGDDKVIQDGADVDGHDDGVSELDVDELNKEVEQLTVFEKVKNNVRREHSRQSHKSVSKGNNTKKRNKYGKIVKGDKIDHGSY